jgi:putative transposase
MAGEGLPAQLATRVLAGSESGYYAWRTRAPSARSIHHVGPTDQILKVHAASNGTYRARRVHAEPTLGRGLVVAHGTVEMLMSRAGIHGVTGRPRWRRPTPDLVSADLVERNFARSAPNQLWVTDITEHPTREGKVYCAVVLDTYSRRGRRLVDRLLTDRGAGHQRPGHGDRHPHPTVGSGDPLRPGRAVRLLGVHRSGQGLRPAALDGQHRRIWHNRHRRHSALGWLSPVECETQNKIIAV